ncbi:NUDIX hydrolase [Gorillibacterium timonense]|uniref:NUDIX hydrolase n=1 Tax=Gorillibacterium timonense TaxID=1689269 RepID=UPI00071E2C51|nr:NUDIX domain-containing protein [Gorillibacterium timonense]
MKVVFYEWDSVKQEEYRFAVIMARHKTKWLFVKHKERSTWEIPGGHRDDGEEIRTTAERELFEETGAVNAELHPLCAYAVQREGEEESLGALFFAEVMELGPMPDSEIGTVSGFVEMPAELTYPSIQPFLWEKGHELLRLRDLSRGDK